jgi:hypothetical protein
MSKETAEEARIRREAEKQELASRLWPVVMPAKYDSEASLYQEMVQLAKSENDLEDDRFYELIASCGLFSHRVQDFLSTPYLFLHGPKNTGKNRILDTLKAFCYRPLLSGSFTSASIFQALDQFHCTPLLDEAEILAPYRKVESDMAQALKQVLNAGYTRGEPVIRGSPDNGLRPYDCYSFKAVASTETLPETTLDRCIPINTERNVRQDVPVLFDWEEAKPITAKLEMYNVNYGLKREAGTLEPMINADSLKPLISNYRVIQLFCGPIAITPDKNAVSHLVELAQELAGTRAEEEQTGEDADLIEALYNSRPEPGIDRVIVATVTANFNLSRDKYEVKRNDWVGRKLRKFGLRPCHVGKDNRRGVLWDEKKLQRRFERYGLSPSKAVGAVGAVGITLKPAGSPTTSLNLDVVGLDPNFTLVPTTPTTTTAIPRDTPTGLGRVTYEKIGAGKITKEEADRWIDGS